MTTVPGRRTIFTCWICNKPVHLNECMTDALGDPVHKTCHAQMMKDEKERRDAKRRMAAS
jgi:hypothetical protein